MPANTTLLGGQSPGEGQPNSTFLSGQAPNTDIQITSNPDFLQAMEKASLGKVDGGFYGHMNVNKLKKTCKVEIIGRGD